MSTNAKKKKKISQLRISFKIMNNKYLFSIAYVTLYLIKMDHADILVIKEKNSCRLDKNLPLQTLSKTC